MTQEEIILIFGMMLVTFGVRYPVLAILGRITMPERVQNALRYVPVAVLMAIIAPAMLMPQGNVEFSMDNAYLVAGIIAIVIAWRTKSLLWTIVLSMMLFLLWRSLFPVTV